MYTTADDEGGTVEKVSLKVAKKKNVRKENRGGGEVDGIFHVFGHDEQIFDAVKDFSQR